MADPTPEQSVRVAAAEVGVPELAWLRAQMAARDGGLQLSGAVLTWAATHLAAALRCLPFLQAHAADYCLDAAALADAHSPLPYFMGLRCAAGRLAAQIDAPAFPLDLASLLSGSPRSMHDLSEGVFASLRDTVVSLVSEPRHAAWLHSCGGLHAGAGLSAIPVSTYLTGRALDGACAALPDCTAHAARDAAAGATADGGGPACGVRQGTGH